MDLLVDPVDRSIVLFRAGTMPRAPRGGDSVDLAAVVPGFRLTADGVFGALRA